MLTLALPATAHTRSELDAWMEAWSEQTGWGLSYVLLTELADMSARHPWYFDPQPTYSTSSASSSTNRGMGANVEQWRGLVSQYFPTSAVNTMMCLMVHESNGNPNALNTSSGAAGLFQVMPFWWNKYGGDRFDPERNVQVALKVYEQQGYGAWSPYNRGLCH